MCQGLAVVAEKIENIWRVHAHEGVTSHDELLHLLREDLRDGVAPHIKFEVYFPMIINDDIQQDVAEKYYPKGWVENKFGKWCACPESVSAVAQYLNENQPLLNFNPQMLHRASLNDASLDGASLNDASLNDASLDGASLNRASLDGASLNGASLNRASLNRASLNRASLNGASLNRASLNRASLNGASLNRASLNRASLNGASLNGASLNGASLNDASLNDASLDGASLDGASLNDASLDGASLNDASLNDASLDGASLNRASLNRASLNDASLNRRTLITFWSEISVAIFEKMYINFELKTRAEIETIIQDAKEGGHQ